MHQGIAEIETYDSIEDEFIKPNYSDYTIQRWVSIFGGHNNYIPHEKVLVYVNADGQVYINNAAPTTVKAAFRTIGINC